VPPSCTWPTCCRTATARPRTAEPPPPIERQVFEGQALTVQVIKDPIGTKGARLSTQVSIAGRMLVFLPHDKHIGISQKIGSPELREQLRARMQALAGKPEEGGGGGFILRTNAEDASDAELADDIAYLRKAWAHDPRARAKRAAGTCCTRT
jgi:ribonuclease G